MSSSCVGLDIVVEAVNSRYRCATRSIRASAGELNAQLLHMRLGGGGS